MSTWLYQLSPTEWPPETFRYEIWEEQRWHWPYRQKRGEGLPDVGHTIVFFYGPSRGSDPGIYGWAVVDRCDEENTMLYFMPVAPTNRLKMDPWWDEEARKLANEIRGGMKQATLFKMSQQHAVRLRRGLRKWLAGSG